MEQEPLRSSDKKQRCLHAMLSAAPLRSDRRFTGDITVLISPLRKTSFKFGNLP